MKSITMKLPVLAPMLAALWMACAGISYAQKVPGCGSLANSEGPFDYRHPPANYLNLVERYHFTESVATLSKGSTGQYIAIDVAYTLRWFPNHTRALLAMATLAQREKKDPPTGSPYTVECWFKRAIAFRPDDEQVRAIYGVVLLQTGKRSDAIEQLKQAIAMAPDDANAHYNLGLAYFGERHFDQALTEAKKAYALGFPLPGLRDMLKRENQWK